MNQTETEKLIEHYGCIFASLSNSAVTMYGRTSKEDLIRYVARLRELVISLPDDRPADTIETMSGHTISTSDAMKRGYAAQGKI